MNKVPFLAGYLRIVGFICNQEDLSCLKVTVNLPCSSELKLNSMKYFELLYSGRIFRPGNSSTLFEISNVVPP